MVTAAQQAYLTRRRHRRRAHIVGQPPAATQDAEYTYTPGIRGGLAPYTLEVVGGALPAGLAVDGETITGTPTDLGYSTAFVKVADANGVFSQKQLSFSVVPA